jgi:hypothetical protein
MRTAKTKHPTTPTDRSFQNATKYLKAIGCSVETRFTEGEKLVATVTDPTDTKFVLRQIASGIMVGAAFQLPDHVDQQAVLKQVNALNYGAIAARFFMKENHSDNSGDAPEAKDCSIVAEAWNPGHCRTEEFARLWTTLNKEIGKFLASPSPHHSDSGDTDL